MNVEQFIQALSIYALPIIFAVTLHEVAHGYVAYWCGDYTAKLSGRLSLNPIHHIDLIGTIIVPVIMLAGTGFMFGWAKPVPVDARNFKNPRRDMALVAIAGPLSNLSMAFLWALICKLGIILMASGNNWFGTPLMLMGKAGILINIVLGVLNLIPIPPLDGSRVLASILPRRAAYKYNMIEPFGFYILIILLLTNVLSYILTPAIMFWVALIYGIFRLPLI